MQSMSIFDSKITEDKNHKDWFNCFDYKSTDSNEESINTLLSFTTWTILIDRMHNINMHIENHTTEHLIKHTN